jgi:multidrug transporter EmrE-like cation transporter
MDRYLLIELGSDGIAIETAQIDFYASWLGIGLVVLSVVAYKIYKVKTKTTKKARY